MFNIFDDNVKIKTAVKRKVTIIKIGSLNVKSIAIELKGKYSFRLMSDKFITYSMIINILEQRWKTVVTWNAFALILYVACRYYIDEPKFQPILEE